MASKRIGLDIDGVLANFLQGFIDRARERGLAHLFPKTWRDWTKHYDGDQEAFEEIWNEVTYDPMFWYTLKPLAHPSELWFPVTGYITARPCPTVVTVEWLAKHGFLPVAPVTTVPYGASKVQAARDLDLDLFIDDNVNNFQELNAAGIKTLLWDTPVNRTHDAGHLRISSFGDVPYVPERLETLAEEPAEAALAVGRPKR